ncbi:hypothetical protein GCM10022287_33480 [Gryllotalpicola koreensis]|uniref:Uncharacterized protein n=1 Tax=Gryllotalpicola koreensis TaxID=993086 RepID=A0ABP8A8Z4_9MICO
MTEAQVWTIIGVFATLFFSMLALMSNMFVRVIRAEIGRLDSKFDIVNAKIDALDRDVQLLFRREFGSDAE